MSKTKRLLKTIVKRLIIVAAFVIVVFGYAIYTKHLQEYKDSEIVINAEVARQVDKDPNDLTEEDFAKVNELLFEDINKLQTLKPLLKVKNLETLTFYFENMDLNVNINFKPLEKLRKLRELNFCCVFASYYVSRAPPKKWYDSIFEFLGIERKPSTQRRPFNLAKLKKLKNLEGLAFQYEEITNFKVLSSFSNLVYLNLSYTKIKNLEPISILVYLENLYLLSNKELKNIEPLASLTNLKNLALCGTEISDIKPLANLTKLEYLSLQSTMVTDISPLAQLINLNTLNLSNTQVKDFQPLEGLTNLETLDIDNTKKTDITPLKKLTNLKKLSLYNTNINKKHIAEIEEALPDLKIEK